jgi:hypothetical protein
MAISYEDLADGFVKLATDPIYDKLEAVGLSSQNAKNELLYIPFVLGKVIRGLMFQFVPGYWQADHTIHRWLDGGFFGRTKQD